MNMEIDYTTNSWMGIIEEKEQIFFMEDEYHCHKCHDRWNKSNEFQCNYCDNSFCGECIQFSKSVYGNYLTSTCEECSLNKFY